MDTTTTHHLTNSYQHCLSEVKLMLANWSKALERYAEKDNASDTYLDLECDKMEVIADYVNTAEAFIESLSDNFISREEHEEIISRIHYGYSRLFDPDYWERTARFWDQVNAGQIDSPIIRQIKALRA